MAIARRYLGVENAHFKRIPGENGDGARVSVAAGDTTSVDDDTELASSGYCTSCSTDESR